jgi:hypothetical protein
MSFWKNLFGGGSPAPAAPKQSAPESYKDFTIRAAPVQNGAQFQAAGIIEKEVDGTRKEHHFIRADFFTSHEDAQTFSLGKARQIIDLQGERVFD